jgi:hypothetical protein
VLRWVAALLLVCWSCPDLTAPRNAPRTYIHCQGNPWDPPSVSSHPDYPCSDELTNPLPYCHSPDY